MFGKDKYMGDKRRPLKMIFFAAMFFLFVAFAAWIVMLLWNAILPDVVGVKPLNFWKAAGLLILAKILFGGFGRHKRKGDGRHRGNWKSKWMNMDEEKRDEMKARWKQYCDDTKQSKNQS